KVVGQVDTVMSRLATSMAEISSASAETQKIVKTIDEIAFQTNLLALNAAVEAARAGEAGAGFAVVADEVRNLAMRAAEAAKNTSELISGTVAKVNTGSQLVSEAGESFSQASQSQQRVGILVADISRSSKEQATSIVQLSNTINEVDAGTQQAASAAEETASASEELSAHAEMLKGIALDLDRLIEGGGADA
ncbi:MAG: methyl-accepting chemotaxis protein, partial [Proteobacteria bacterium]|nr:methyl-accepting chemotaxis protein [Pseudomonadota bacterium]